jgi:hypothetical protein
MSVTIGVLVNTVRTPSPGARINRRLHTVDLIKTNHHTVLVRLGDGNIIKRRKRDIRA